MDAPANCSALPLSQHPSLATALCRLGRTARRVDLGPAGSALLVERRIGPVRLAATLRGPAWRGDAAPADRIGALLALRHAGLRLVEAEIPADAVALRAAGFAQVMTPSHVAELDLAGDEAARRARMTSRWRSHLRQAEAAGLQVRDAPWLPAAERGRVAPRTPRGYFRTEERRTPDPAGEGHWLLRAEAALRRERGYRAMPQALTVAWAAAHPGQARIFSVDAGGAPIAAMLFLRHGPVATYQMGWSGPEGRARSAHHLILTVAATHYAREGVVRIDLGTVDDAAAPGLARFKAGSGARIRTLGGSWLALWPMRGRRVPGGGGTALVTPGERA